MPGDNSEVATAAALFHEDIPHRFQVSLTMSMDTRDSLRAVRDAINEECNEQVFTTDDVIRMALLGTACYHAHASVEDSVTRDCDTGPLFPLSEVVRELLEADTGEVSSTSQSSE